MSVAEEIRQEQKKALSTMSRKEKLAYFWDYYKIHVLVAVALIAVAASFIHQYVTNKDYGFYAALINTSPAGPGQDLTSKWAAEFQEYAQIDPGQYQVYIDTSFALSDEMASQYSMANQQKLIAMLQIGTISAITAETETFERYAQAEMFCPLEDILSAEEVEKYRPYFYYTDAATFEQDEADNDNTAVMKDSSSLTINHRDPSDMDAPVAVGIVLTDDNLLADSGLYAYLEDAQYDFQGYQADVILGIPHTNEKPELVVRFLEYMKLGED